MMKKISMKITKNKMKMMRMIKNKQIKIAKKIKLDIMLKLFINV